MRLFLFVLFLFINHVNAQEIRFDGPNMKEVPVLYKGRIRPLETVSRLWMEEIAHKESFTAKDRQIYKANSPLDLLWKLYFYGHTEWDDVPLFWIDSNEVRHLLQLDERPRFSYSTLHQAILTHNDSSAELQPLIENLSLFESLKGAQNSQQSQMQASTVDLLPLLPVKNNPAVWKSPGALVLPNFTPYSSQQYEKLRSLYHELIKSPESSSENFAKALNDSYMQIAGRALLGGSVKTLFYPTTSQLRAEAYFYRIPFVELAMTFYFLASVGFLYAFWKNKQSIYPFCTIALFCGFLIQTALLVMRCYILNRPPVSNMFESVIYVPWMIVLAALILRIFLKSNLLLLSASISALLLLIVLHLTKLSNSMENVQAVLDSQYWLIVHVLMVVGSYGLFILTGVMGHVYLTAMSLNSKSALISNLPKAILQCMYLGTALLIPGTILGGVWAAESWGRFWDWDPKEAWAFISGCIYLLWIHAYRFRVIRELGLAIGSIVGLMSISFTWYGVNYILGTGLHSYGFGTGGEIYYYLFLFAETLFICMMILLMRKRQGARNG